MKEANEAKAQKTLSTLMRYDGVVMSRKEWIEIQHKNGSTTRLDEKNKIMFDRRKFNRMNYAEQEAYEKRCNEKVPFFRLDKGDGIYYEITKAEFDYFNSL